MRFISVKKALENLLKEYDITINDVLDAMDEDRISVEASLRKICTLSDEELEEIENRLSSKEINLLIFLIHAFYIADLSGLYKDNLIAPSREEIMVGGKVTFEGLKKLARALGFTID
jgi:hypothetical protein